MIQDYDQMKSSNVDQRHMGANVPIKVHHIWNLGGSPCFGMSTPSVQITDANVPRQTSL